ncbi:hypothetical protein GCM10010191_89690 [Actinomadura vinacea]|uniref:Uncharacterized protein n=1 Tax=Actinomadura vinacea TaxID=115336 RepID=A0ABN3KGK3_9ACTN
MRLTSISPASALLDGSRSPALSRPSRIADRNCPASCSFKGFAVERSTVKGRSNKVVSRYQHQVALQAMPLPS